jgi:hypothetical protein
MNFTPLQLGVLAIVLLFCIFISGKVPSDWRVQNLPAGIVLGFFIFCVFFAGVMALDLKPHKWWINLFLYRLNVARRIYISKPEPGHLYPNPDIIEPGKVQDDYYIDGSKTR